MPSLQTMRERIADELNRSDLSAEIDRQINSAVRHYESTRMRWNEVRDWVVATTVPGARYYSLTSDFLRFDSLKIARSGNYVDLRPRTWKSIEDRDSQVTASTGVPSDYVVYADQLRIYPAPDSSMTLIGSYIQRATTTTLTASSSGGWLAYTGGEELIRARAVAGVRVDRLRQPQALAEMAQLAAQGKMFLSIKEGIAYAALVDERNDALASGFIDPDPI